MTQHHDKGGFNRAQGPTGTRVCQGQERRQKDAGVPRQTEERCQTDLGAGGSPVPFLFNDVKALTLNSDGLQ